jgi:Holliday junction DNA helicase RuvA
MITYLKGKIQYIGQNYIEVNVGSIGYRVFVGENIINSLHVGKEIEIFTHQHVREDTLDLFGFLTRPELGLFEKLIGISGIGPKTALGVLSLASVDDIESAIIRGDAAILTKVSGVGKKTAERIVLELKNKFKGKVELGERQSGNFEDSDVLDALVGLGYGIDDARSALKNIDSEIKGADEKIKACLKALGR